VLRLNRETVGAAQCGRPGFGTHRSHTNLGRPNVAPGFGTHRSHTNLGRPNVAALVSALIALTPIWGGHAGPPLH
jgi:hypothetical protein